MSERKLAEAKKALEEAQNLYDQATAKAETTSAEVDRTRADYFQNYPAEAKQIWWKAWKMMSYQKGQTTRGP